MTVDQPLRWSRNRDNDLRGLDEQTSNFLFFTVFTLPTPPKRFNHRLPAMTQRKLRVLVAYSMWSNFTPTISEYLLALKQFSAFNVSYANVTNGAVLDFDLNSFDIVFNNYCARFVTDGLVSDSYRRALKDFRGLKVIAVQDEYDQTNKFRAAVREYGFHVLLTCVPPEFWSRVYPCSELPGLQLIHVLTGYVPEMAVASNHSVPPLKDRPILIGYRGGYIGARYGQACVR